MGSVFVAFLVAGFRVDVRGSFWLLGFLVVVVSGLGPFDEFKEKISLMR